MSTMLLLFLLITLHVDDEDVESISGKFFCLCQVHDC